MKFPLFLLPLLILPLRAEILATFETNLGNVVVSLQYDKTPQTVANFITLAEGTRSSLDPATGAVRPKRFYKGETFYRVVNNPDFKIAQTGSGTGSNSGGPGYKFRDELHPDLKHDPYVLAMANGGPNTNGSQIYLTGSAAIPSLDGKHTVFGLVTDPSSRVVTDAIINGGENVTSIGNVTIQRIGEAAVAFDEFAWNLPTCQALPGALVVDASGGFNDVAYKWAIPVPLASVFRVSGSLDLQSWGEPGQFTAPFNYPAGLTIGIDQTLQSRKFYNISLTTFPNPIYQPDLRGRTMVLEGMEQTGDVTYTLQFDPDVTDVVLTKSSNPGQSDTFAYNYNAESYGSTLVVFSPESLIFPLIVVCGFDSETISGIAGRHSTSQSIGGQKFPYGSGTLTLSK